jgi:hypothetical protein
VKCISFNSSEFRSRFEGQWWKRCALIETSSSKNFNIAIQLNTWIRSKYRKKKKKDRSQRVSTEAGIQIDSNDRQPESALVSIRLSQDPDSKVKNIIHLQPQKHPLPRIWISRFNRTFLSWPIYLISVTRPKSTRKSPRTWKWRFPSSIVTSEIFLSVKAELPLIPSSSVIDQPSPRPFSWSLGSIFPPSSLVREDVHLLMVWSAYDRFGCSSQRLVICRGIVVLVRVFVRLVGKRKV